jgi:hypothetical protein
MHVLLLTESAGASGFPVLRELVKKMLHLVGEGAAIQRVEFERADEVARAAMGFNSYKSTHKRDHHKQIDLAAAIATWLLRNDRQPFAVVHVDGDRRWSERGAEDHTVCPNREIFERTIVRRVRELLHRQGHPERLERLLYAIPFWSTEAWTFQNSAELERLCAKHGQRHHADAELLRRWRENPAMLDEEEYPKDRACTIGDRYNFELAQSLPGRKLRDLGLSFSASVDGLERCTPLIETLRTLRHDSA